MRERDPEVHPPALQNEHANQDPIMHTESS